MLVISAASLVLAATPSGEKADTVYLLIGEAVQQTYEKTAYLQQIIEAQGYKFVKLESKDYFVTDTVKTKAIIALQPDKAMLADIYAKVNYGENAIIVLDNDAYVNAPETLAEIYNLFGIKIAKTPLAIGKGSIIYGADYCSILGALVKLPGNLNTQIIIDTLHKGQVTVEGVIHFYSLNNAILGGNPATFYSEAEDMGLVTSAQVAIGKGKCLILAGGGTFGIFSDTNVKKAEENRTTAEVGLNGNNYGAIKNVIKWAVKEKGVLVVPTFIYLLAGGCFIVSLLLARRKKEAPNKKKESRDQR
jgi:hypothetical protein